MFKKIINFIISITVISFLFGCDLFKDDETTENASINNVWEIASDYDNEDQETTTYPYAPSGTNALVRGYLEISDNSLVRSYFYISGYQDQAYNGLWTCPEMDRTYSQDGSQYTSGDETLTITISGNTMRIDETDGDYQVYVLSGRSAIDGAQENCELLEELMN